MRILVISHLFPHEDELRYGVFVARQLCAMAAQGADITVIVPTVWCPSVLRRFKRWQRYSHRKQLCAYPPLKTHLSSFLRLPGNWFNRWAGLSAYCSMRTLAERLHYEKRFDVIYARDFFPDGDVAWRLSRILGIPAICMGIGVDVNVTATSTPVMYKHFIRIATSLNGTIAHGKGVADKIDAVTNKRSLCVHGTLNLDEFMPCSNKQEIRKQLGLNNDAVILLYAGYLDRRKGLYELIESYSMAAAHLKNSQMVLCGHGGEKSGLAALAQSKGIADNVYFAGDISPDQMHLWMKAADIFVLPSHTEGMPNVVMEAMACGLPVITTNVGGLPDAIGDCEGSILIEPKDIVALKDAIVTVASDEHLQSRMGLASRARAEQRFGAAINAKRILEYLTEIIEAYKQQVLR